MDIEREIDDIEWYRGALPIYEENGVETPHYIKVKKLHQKTSTIIALVKKFHQNHLSALAEKIKSKTYEYGFLQKKV